LYGGGKEVKGTTNQSRRRRSTGRGEIASLEQQMGKEELMEMGTNHTQRTGRKKKSHRNGLKDRTEMNPGTNRRNGVGRNRRRRIESGKHLTESGVRDVSERLSDESTRKREGREGDVPPHSHTHRLITHTSGIVQRYHCTMILCRL
jgi:hypothetical protein